MSEIKNNLEKNITSAKKHFCTCPVTGCKRHPTNHKNGCDPCIKDNIEKGKMPACMFKAVRDDVSEVSDYTIKGFVDFYLKQSRLS